MPSHAVSGHFNGFAVKCRQITTVARLILANAALHSTCCWLFQGHSASLACYVAGVNLLFSEATLVTRWSVHVYQVFLLLSPASSCLFSSHLSLLSQYSSHIIPEHLCFPVAVLLQSPIATMFRWLHSIGVALIFIASILLLITTISSPVIGDIAILKVMLTNSTNIRHSSVTFGTFGHCILDVPPVT